MSMSGEDVGGLEPQQYRVLDCTIRDGGFYSGWDFSPDFVRDYVRSASLAGIDYIEIGYRSCIVSGSAGPFKYSDETVVRDLVEPFDTKIALMIDAKEFASDEARIRDVLGPSQESRASLIRFATIAANLPSTARQVRIASDMGYATTINLMAFGGVPVPEQEPLIRMIAESAADVVYIADSYGSMYPSDVVAAARLIRDVTDKEWGIHLHNNQELAFANAMVALEEGAAWIDCSVLGMGRGPGNLRTEILLQYLQARRGDTRYRTEPIYELIDQHVLELHREFGWGPTPAYVLSGSLGVHPTYAQNLLGSGRYRVSEVVGILQQLHDGQSGGAFDRHALDVAISSRSPVAGGVGTAARDDELRADWSEREVLIVGRGPSATRHGKGINAFIAQTEPVVIECNHLPHIESAPEHFCAFVVAANASTLASAAARAGKKLIYGIGLDSAPRSPNQESASYFVPYRVEAGRLDPEGMTVPADVVSMYAICLAVRNGARKISVVGFDGYTTGATPRDLRMQTEMDDFFGLMRTNCEGTELVSLLPTAYEIRTESLYGRLFWERRPGKGA